MTKVPTKKRFGQHWLADGNMVRRIIEALEAQPEDAVLEVGPGPGTLTIPMHEQGITPTVVEFDRDMATLLENQGFDPPIRIVNADFMKVDLDELLDRDTKIVSNLPYNVSVPITMRLMAYAHRVPLMVLMYQKEVADRLTAKPNTKDYGIVSVPTQLLYDADLSFKVSPGCFRPPPKVMSRVVRFRRKPEPGVTREELPLLFDLLRQVFAQRRKTIKSNLKSWPHGWTRKETLLESLVSMNISPGSRAEDLSPEQFATWLRTALQQDG